MKNGLLKVANKLNKKHKQRKWWQRTVRAMGTVVVFCTTYALILPAITMEQEPICGIEAHEHGEGCYTQQPVAAFVCDLEEGANLIHSHEAICCDAQNVLICPLPEIKEHTHDDSCYSLSEQTTCGYAHVHSDACVTVQTVQVCGQEETSGHTHSDACTTQVNLICQIPEEAGHTHSEDCGSVTTNLICTEAEGETHSHSEGCYETIRTPCEIPESAGHTHTDGCYETLAVSCEIPESAGHTHNETCYESQEVPCEKTTDDGHVHTESCYTKQLNCNLAEVKLHTHDSITCYSADGTLTCTIPEYRKHVHGESCLVQTEQMQDVLTCGLEVHVHEEKCYPVEEEDQYAYICGFGVHAHLETCYNEAGELVCSIPEHIHDASCIVEDLDLTADVETAEQWEETFADVVLTGNWPKDILAVAETQLDYKESEKNLILEDGQLKGYTRYGAWYGEPYGKWDAMFVSFCLNYGGVEDFPLESDADRWIAALEEKQLYQTSDTYSPKPGDLIFIDFDQTVEAAEAGEEVPVTADLVGIVAERIPATEEKPAQYQFIAGDCDNQVSYMTCDVDDITIVGYGQMPSGEISYMTYEGTGFTVTVTLGKDAGIPETAQLAVREILPETPDYAFYYSQSLEALAGDSAEEQPEISFARFFDITFVDNGTPIEPAIPVDVVISYSNAIPVKEEENGKIVHFAKDGVEVLETDTSLADPSKEEAGILSAITELFTDKTEQVDTFRFTQNSFSVSGTVVASRAAGVTVYPANLTSLDGTGGTSYVIYTYYNYRYYAIAAPAANANNSKLGSMIQLTQNADGSFSWSGNQNVLWNFAETAANTYDITNENGRYLHAFWNNNGSDVGVIGTNSKGTAIIRDGNRFRVKHPSSNVYVSISNGYFYPTTNQNNATYFYIAEVPSNVYHVWFDGTNGGMMSYYGASDTYQAVSRNDNTITLPTTAQSSTKYDYKLNGWYDIKTNQYYKPGEEVTIHQNTVFYADWVAATYDVGQDNEYVVESLNTDDFITTHVFDYNNLFNMQSVTHTGSVSAIGHKETWTIVNNGTVPYQDANTLGFVFVDYDSDGEITYPLDRDTTNINQGEAITADILEEVKTASGGKDLLDLLFNPATSVIGKNYVGKGNYLFQYMDSTTENYDGIHDGYYYLDARLNAASYNKTEERFYLYDYLERTSDSNKDRGVGQYSDFLPFNSPYIFDADQLDPYTDSIATPGYEYDAKDGENSFKEFNSVDDANTNYFFGIRTDIEFFLTNNAGTTDEYGNYGNISTRGEHMIFDFHGDDDVWVFIDDELVLDIGGLHGVMFGQIDFSTGTVISGKDGGTTTSVSFTELLGHNITEGTHNMTVYYMERGSSQSNCAIYFNIAPRYDLEITKEDIYTTALLDGAEFTIYSCEGCANTCVECLQGDCTIESHKAAPLTTCATHGADLQYAELWTSQEAHNLDMDDKVVDDAIHTITTVNGKAYCWGLAAGKTYYIKETLPPHDYDPGYPRNDDVIRVTLNNRGTATIETTTLHGTDSQITEGYAVIEQSVDNTLKVVALTITNQRDEDTTQIRVKKVWDTQATDLPNSITAYLSVNGKQVGRPAVLTEANGWVYTWTGLPKYETDGVTEIQYQVGEIQVPGFNTEYTRTDELTESVEWVNSDAMEDSAIYLLLNGGRALTYNGSSFSWTTQANAQNDVAAQWSVTTNHDGFRLTNGNGYSMTYDRSQNRFVGNRNMDNSLNQVIYYLDGRLVAHDHDRYFQMSLTSGVIGSAVNEDGLVFSLVRRDLVTGTVVEMKNALVENEKQTFVSVNKIWDDYEDHSKDSVTIHLYADGNDTGQFLVLNQANGWSGTFDGLPYYAAHGVTPIVYTVEEDEPPEYDASYESSERNGLTIVTWVKQETLTAGEIYRIVSGANALAVGTDGTLTVKVNDPNDQSQWWTPVSENWNKTVLKQYNGNRYLLLNGDAVTLTDSQSTATSITLNGEKLMLDDRYLQMTKTTVSVSQYEYNATLFTVARRTEGEGMPGTAVTVTNSVEIGVELPMTGGIGTFHLTFGGLLILSTSLMYFCMTGRKRQRGGK